MPATRSTPNELILGLVSISDRASRGVYADEGIPAGGEGDLQTIMTMLMAYAVTGKPAFMGNPSFIDRKRNELILAHCSVPTKMVDEFIIRDHFETGRGIGLQGLMHEGDILRIRPLWSSGNMKRTIWSRTACPSHRT